MSAEVDDQPPPEHDLARQVAARIFDELQPASVVYATVHQQLTDAGQLDAESGESAIHVIAKVATTLRRSAPSLAETESLPEAPRLELALLLLRLITDSLSVALAERPAYELLVSPQDVAAAPRRYPSRA